MASGEPENNSSANNPLAPPASGHSDQAGAPAPTKMTPELVRQVADKVFMLMLRDLQVERERVRSYTFQARR